MLMNRLQQVNPNGYKFVKEAMANNRNPKEVLNEVLKEKNMSSEQLSAFKKEAHTLGVPNNVLDKLS